MSDTIVAVDGPAGSGKSSVSREAARRLGFAYLAVRLERQASRAGGWIPDIERDHSSLAASHRARGIGQRGFRITNGERTAWCGQLEHRRENR